jgi:hypothetical protein
MLAAKEIDGGIDIGEPDDNYVDAIHTLSSEASGAAYELIDG